MSTGKPLSCAPAALINLHGKGGGRKVHIKENGRIVRSRDILWELLTDSKMERPWEMLKKHCSGPEDYTRIWSEIVLALRRSRTPEPSRIKKRDNFIAVANHARGLASSIAEGPLDRLTYNYFPDEMAALLFNAKKWPILRPDEKCTVAHKVLSWWPSITELLEEVGRHAEKLAKEASIEDRFAINDTQERRANYFLQHLARHFRAQFNSPMKGVLAEIASVVFEKSITLDFVKRALRHTKPRP